MKYRLPMIDFSGRTFERDMIRIPEGTQAIFVADVFVEDYVGGAELTSEALIASSPIQIFKLRSKDVTMELLSSGSDLFWIFGNFCELNPQLIPSVIANLKYSILEYDYKFCRMRSPEKHFETLGVPCDCSNQINGKMISTFFYASMGNWWMSEKQKERYLTMFPFLQERNNVVLSSVFNKQTLGFLQELRERPKQRSGWIVLGSASWIKGAQDAENWCKLNNKKYEIVWNLPYDQLLRKLSTAEGFVYLPKGGDTCPRMVIEAKLLDCKLQLNDNVQHKDEDWFATDDLTSIQDYLFTAPEIFWRGIKSFMDYKPKISGYVTTYNCVKQKYPFEQCIQSMLTFCEEVCVVDGGSTDGTLERLQALVSENTTRSKPEFEHLKVKVIPRDWSSKHHPIFDGMQKAEARAMCTGDFCWQMDADEVVHEDDVKKIFDICKAIPNGADIVALPVIEGWGGWDKIRCDVNPWKWRLSRNASHITHGIPQELRRFDGEGNLYAAPGTDGCDMIDRGTFERLPHLSFYPPEVDAVRVAGLRGDEGARQQYEQWFNNAVNSLPAVFHCSWIDLSRKIKLYRDYWQTHWLSLYDADTSDTADNNMFFDVPWSQVTNEMIEVRSQELKQVGGWVFHRKWNGEKIPWIRCNRTLPKVIAA